MTRTRVAVAAGLAAAGSLALVGQASAANVPANCTVNGPGALSLAIAAANPGDTVQVDGTCAGGQTVSKDLTIVGVANTPTISGGGFGVASSGAGTDVVVGDIKVTGANVGLVAFAGTSMTAGGGANVTGNFQVGMYTPGAGALAASSATVSNNGTPGSEFGGILSQNGTLSVSGTVVQGNLGGRADGSVPTGGGITKFGGPPLVISGSVVTGNSSVIVAAQAGSGNGGGLWTNRRTTISGSVFTGNTAARRGGGIYKINSAPLATNAALSLTGTVVTGNSAGINGGGIFSIASTVSASIFLGNVVTGNSPNNIAT